MIDSRFKLRRCLTHWCGVLLTLLVITPTGGRAADEPYKDHAPTEIEKRIKFYSEQIAAHPRLYPAHAMLGKAYLDRAAWTGNPADLARAEASVEESLGIQSNLEALLIAAALSNYRHRFERTLEWCQRCDDASPNHPEVLAMRVEALLALARHDEARQAIDQRAELVVDAYVLGCRATLRGVEGERSQALALLQEAFQQAQVEERDEFAVWTQVASAGLCIDSGHFDEAVPFLEEAESRAPESPDVIVHRAEYDEGVGNLESALKRYSKLLTRRADPEVHRRCASLCRRLGQLDQAATHFAAAERIWQSAVDRGEVYPLEGLTHLYCDAQTKLTYALRLSEQNLQYKRDAGAIAARDLAQSLQAIREP